MTDRGDRVVGVLLGMACGDALGVPYEFASRPLGPDEEPAMVGGGLGPYAPAEWSDDTQMAAVIAQVAADSDLRDVRALDRIAEGWIGWMREGASDIGNQTWQVLSTAARWDPDTGAAERVRTAARNLHEQTGHTAGNGSLMRTAPVALAFLDDPAALAATARVISDLTHPDPIAGDACVIWCEAIRRAVVTGDDVDLVDVLELLPAVRRDEWRQRILAAEEELPHAFNPNGYAPVALQAAWSAINHPWTSGKHSDNRLTGSLVAAVHAGNDTDTVAAIAGGYLGARWGASVVPGEWLAVHGWPGLTAADLRALAGRIAAG
jgi:ADP-ribosyl-[dinitrogen reductase] hydrolase